MHWLRGALVRCFTFFVASVAGTSTLAVFLGYEDDAKAWLVEHRPVMPLFLALYIVLFLMYDWLWERENL